jgi:hypothetical protein
MTTRQEIIDALPQVPMPPREEPSMTPERAMAIIMAGVDQRAAEK